MPSLSMATSLIAFGLLKAYTALMTRLGWKHAQFTPQACPRPRLPAISCPSPSTVVACRSYVVSTRTVLVGGTGACALHPCTAGQR
jgi:hypothetical protein